MIKVSHETPLCLLEDSRKFNDYDYCLPHLLDEEAGYENISAKQKKKDVTLLWITHYMS
jgi:hypothetical protein